MKERRSASQILFGYLPEQTVDLRNSVWKVKDWRNPIVRHEVDDATLRAAVLRLLSPWRRQSMDSGFSSALEKGARLQVVTVDENNGVDVEPFPRIWVCKSCKRIHDTPEAACPCGAKGEKGQLFFVGYHEACGALREPFIPRCREHRQVAVHFPGTASATEIRFYCPVCNVTIRQGFGFAPCSCGGDGSLVYQPHRAASVYTPRAVVIVNPPSKERMRVISEAGGAPKALAWVVNGMETRSMQEMPNSRESLRRTLMAQGLPPEMIEKMLDLAASGGEAKEDDVQLPSARRDDAEAQAVMVAVAMSDSRVRIHDLIAGTDASSDLGKLYRDAYPKSLSIAGLAGIDLIEKFPVLTGHFGYTRGRHDPGVGRLVPYRSSNGYRIYADLAETEALYVQLDPARVASWLSAKGHKLSAWNDSKTARISILEAADCPETFDNHTGSIGADLLELVHSYAHRFLRTAAVFAGIDRNALSELLTPLHLGFFIYAAARGDFVLGGLQAVFEGELHRLLDAVVFDERRCPLDPGCSDAGGACMACLHVGEPSCRYFNRFLSRNTLFGGNGYLTGSVATPSST